VTGWRDPQAAEFDRQAAVLKIAEDALEDAYAVLELRNRAQSCTELRATASLLRLEARTLSDMARELRTGVPETVLPISFTTRRRP
jgi:hypothetical protein